MEPQSKPRSQSRADVSYIFKECSNFKVLRRLYILSGFLADWLCFQNDAISAPFLWLRSVVCFACVCSGCRTF